MCANMASLTSEKVPFTMLLENGGAFVHEGHVKLTHMMSKDVKQAISSSCSMEK